jgi:hypothetical protein
MLKLESRGEFGPQRPILGDFDLLFPFYIVRRAGGPPLRFWFSQRWGHAARSAIVPRKWNSEA